MLSYLLLVDVAVSMRRQGIVFRGLGFQIWVGQVKPSSPIYWINNVFLKSFFVPQSCLKENRSCLRGLGCGSAEVVSANQEGGKYKRKINLCYLHLHAVYGNYLQNDRATVGNGTVHLSAYAPVMKKIQVMWMESFRYWAVLPTQAALKTVYCSDMRFNSLLEKWVFNRHVSWEVLFVSYMWNRH